MGEKIMKKALSLLIALVLCLSVCGCAADNITQISSENSQISATADGTSSAENDLSGGAAVDPNSNPEEGQNYNKTNVSSANKKVAATAATTLANIPAYSGKAYITLNNSVPLFEGTNSTKSFESYSPLDSLGRCGVAFACIGKDLMPTEKRGEIGMIKPTGWQTAKYDFVDGKYLYNRCHLIGFQLSGENANKRNLITGTRYLNIEGMLPFENMVADYVKETGNHVLYRVTPIFSGNNLLASGVTIEGKSVEDNGKEICFYVYCYNVQPGVNINYADGSNAALGQTATSSKVAVSSKATVTSNTDVSSKTTTTSKTAVQSVSSTKTATAVLQSSTSKTYVLNTNTKKFHYPNCGSAKQIAEKNKQTYSGDRQTLVNQGYAACKKCNP